MKNFLRLVLTVFLISLITACTAAAPSPTAAPPAPTNTTAAAVEPTTAPEPTDAPTEEAAPTEEPTSEPTEEPTAEPTEEPTATAEVAADEGGELVVFAAASLTDAFEEIGTLFESQHDGATVTFNFAGSQQLAQQLGQGAPADVFASANKSQMDVAVEASRVVTGTQQTFVRNRLVVIYPTDNPGGVATLQDLAKPGLKLILAAAEVPVGQYSLDFLDKATADAAFDPAFKDTVLANVVSYEDNVRSVLSKIALGEGDAGIVYSSDVSGEGSENVTTLEIPDELNTIASYPIAPVSDTEKPILAQAFIDLVASPEGQEILVQYGFISTTGNATGAAPVAGPLEISGLVDNLTTLTVDDIAAMEQVDVQATDRDSAEATYTGVLISDLLEAAGVQDGATEVVFTGGDGYSQPVPLADLESCEDCIVSVLEDGSLRNILPATMPRYWVKGLVSMVVQ